MHYSKRICCLLTLFAFLSCTCFAQIPVSNVEKQVKEMGLSTINTEGTIIYFDKADSIRSRELADLSVSMQQFYKKKFQISCNLKVAALQPGNWFSEFPGIPYAIPWPYFPDRIIMMPASLTAGMMISEHRTRRQNKWFVDFVLVHEYSHFVEKDYFRATDANEYLGVKWFGEFLANYLAYAYVHTTDTAWANGAKKLWRQNLKAYTPVKFTLDWSFMNELPPQELGPTYGWYQVMLNLKAAELYEKHGLEFLQNLKQRLPWQASVNWNTKMLIPLLEDIYPGFKEWSQNIKSYSMLD